MATSGAEVFVDITDANVWLTEVWSKQASIARERKMVWAANVDRTYEPELKKGQILHIGRVRELEARSKGENTAIYYESDLDVEDTLTINVFSYAAFAMEDVLTPMVDANLIALYMPKIGYALAKEIDVAIAALINAGSPITQTVGTLATGLTYDNIVRADQYLNDGDAPEDERVIIISNAEKANWLKMDQFINKDYSEIRSGLLGSVFNYPIFVSNSTAGSASAGHANCMMHKSSIMLAIQIQPSIKTAWDIDYLCAKVVALNTYGIDLNEAYTGTHTVYMKGL